MTHHTLVTYNFNTYIQKICQQTCVDVLLKAENDEAHISHIQPHHIHSGQYLLHLCRCIVEVSRTNMTDLERSNISHPQRTIFKSFLLMYYLEIEMSLDQLFNVRSHHIHVEQYEKE